MKYCISRGVHQYFQRWASIKRNFLSEHVKISDADPVELGIIRIRIQDPEILHTNPDPRKKPHKIQFFQILWKKTYRTYRYRKAALFGKGPKRTAEVTEELPSSMRMAKVTERQLRSHENR